MTSLNKLVHGISRIMCAVWSIEIMKINLLVGFIYSLATTLFSSAVFAQCDPSNIPNLIVHNPDSDVLRAEYTFKKGTTTLNGRNYDIVDTEERVIGKSDNLVSEYNTLFNQQAPKSESCTTQYNLLPKRFSLIPNEKLRASAPVNVSKWSCVKHEWVCCKWLKCRTCTNIIKNKWFEKTVNINTDFTIDVIPSSNDLTLSSSTTIDDRGGIPNGLLNVIGVLTFNTGSKWILDNYRANLGKFKDKLVDPDPRQQEFDPDRVVMQMKIVSAGFVQEGGKQYIEINSTSKNRPEKTCEFYESLPKNTEVTAPTPGPAPQPAQTTPRVYYPKQNRICTAGGGCRDYLIP